MRIEKGTQKPFNDTNRKAKILAIMLSVLVCEVIIMGALYYVDTDRKDAFMMPCLQHQNVDVCLDRWQVEKRKAQK